jgi:hypothetical protein
MSYFQARAQDIEVLSKPINIEPKKTNTAKDDAYKSALHKKLMGYWQDERRRQGPNRQQMATDEDFYDSRQLSAEDIQIMRERGQPTLVFNRLKTPIKWILGNEKQTRREFKVLPREENDSAAAQIKFEVMKWLNDVNMSGFHSGKAFEDAVIAGIGWTEVLHDAGSEHGVVKRYQWWREIYHDSRDRSFDLSGARYIIRAKWVDLDMAISAFPDKEALLRRAADDSENSSNSNYFYGEDLTKQDEDYLSYTERDGFLSNHHFDGGREEQVQLIEVRYRIPDPNNPGKTMVRFALMVEVEDGIIYDIENPYEHGHFGFVPRYCERGKSDNLPYGIIRDRRDTQEEHNKRRNKAIHILSTRRIIMEKGAVEDMDLLRDEAARSDSIIELDDGAKRFEMTVDNQIAEGHIRLMEISAREIEDGMGVTDEQMGRQSNAVSGKAILGRQTQGKTVNASLMENAWHGEQLEGLLMLSLIEQFIDQETTIRITGENGAAKFLKLNGVLEDGQPDPSNTIVGRQSDFVLAPMDQTATARMHYLELLLEVASQVGQTNAELGQRLVMAAMSVSDLPFRDQILADMRMSMGMRDPTKPATKEEEAQQQQQQAEAAQMQAQQAAEALRNAKLMNDELEAKIQTHGAQLEKIFAETLDKKMEGYFSAMQASIQLLQNPSIAPIADSMLASNAGQAGIDAGQVPAQTMAQPPAASQGQEVTDPAAMNEPAALQPEVIDSQPATPGVGQNAGINPTQGAS